MQTVSLDFHQGQLPVYAAYKQGKRFIILRCGRRFGKTEFSCRIAVKYAHEHAGCLIWWVSPSYRLSRIGRKKFRKFLKDRRLWNQVIAKERHDPPFYIFQNQSELHFLTAENEDQLVGEGVDLLIFDECARARPTAWQECLAPTLLDNPRSRALFTSTPRGRNWLHGLEMHALAHGASFDDRGKLVQQGSPDSPWAIFHRTSYDNALLTKEQIDELVGVSNMPEEFVQQEIYAEYIGDMLEAFPGWRECLGSKQLPPEPGHTYSIGFDLGHKKDFCVISVVDRKTLDEVYIDRFRDPDFATQEARLANIAKQYPGTVLMESNGPGDPEIEQLRTRYQLNIDDVVASARLNSMLIKHFRVLVANHSIRLIDEPVANEEMESFELMLNPRTNLFSGTAPSGKHDDTVSARLLAYWGVGSTGTAIPTGVRTTGERRHAYQVAGVF